jgi:FMN phosphatase YigB (HAD superfamily)
MLKAVVFDLYETLVTESGSGIRNAGSLGESFGLDAKAFRREWKPLRPLALCGQLTFRAALTEAGTRVGVAIPPALVQQACDERARAKSALFQRIDPALVALTHELRERGLRLAVISNCMAEDVAAWPDSPLAPDFACTMFSFAAGVVKPDARIYLEALRQLDVNADDALYIGDGGDDELAGARRAGLSGAQAVWFVSRDISPSEQVIVKPDDVTRLAVDR